MGKRKLIIGLLVIALLFISGCSSALQPNSEGVYEISFERSLSQSEMASLHNKEVEIKGFYSISEENFRSLMEEADFGYLMNDPFHTCLYCTQNEPSKNFSNTLAMHSKEGVKFEYTKMPIIAKGIFKYEEVTDSYGNNYNYRIVDVVIEEIDSGSLKGDLKVFSELIDIEFDVKFNNYMNKLAHLSDFNSLGIPAGTLDEIDVGSIEEIRNDLSSITKGNYKVEVLNVVDKAESLGIELNNLLEYKDWSQMTSKVEEAQNLYSEYFKLITKPKL